MKHVKNTPSLKDWNLEAVDEIGKALEGVVLKAAAEALHCAIQDSEMSIYFPAEWGKHDGIGNKNPDPLDVYLSVGITPDADNPAYYSFNLRECLADTLELCAEDGSFSAGLAKISESLKSLATDIDTAIETGKKSAE